MTLDGLDQRLRGEGGFTLIESIVAALLVGLVSVAVMAVFDTSRRATYRAEQSQVASDLAERELEGIRSLPYLDIGLATPPGTSADPTNPLSRVNGTDFQINRNGPVEEDPLVIDGDPLYEGGTSGGAVAPGPTPFTSGDVSGNIYRFVVWRDDPNCSETYCEGPQDLKRAIVVVTLDQTATGGERGYTEVKSDIVDPADSIITDETPPDLGEEVVAQQFWLSDARCEAGGEPNRSSFPALSSHAVRDTFGNDCGGSTSGRPDALVTSPPYNTDLTLDFATDLEPTPPDADAGLQFLLSSSNGCHFKPSGTNGYKQSHLWVGPPLASDFQLTGGATLEIWARAINDISTSGTVCITLFRRTENGGGLPPTDVRIPNPANGNLFFTNTFTSFPRGDWGQVRVPMTFDPTTALAGERIGIALTLDKADTPSDQVMFQYDHFDLDSRLEVETTTPIVVGS